MRILYVCGDTGIEIGGRKGASTHVRETCHALKRRGHEVEIVSPCPGDLSRVEVTVHTIPKATSRLLGFDGRYIVGNFHMGRELRRIVARFRPDAVYERYSLYQTAGLSLCHRLGLPRILEINTFLAREMVDRLKFPRLAAFVERGLWRRERALVTVSETLRRMVIDETGIDPDAMAGFVACPVAVDPEMFHPGIEPGPEPLAFARGRRLLGYVGTLTAWHGIEMFFQAARLLKDGGHPVAIYAVGGPEARAERFRARAEAEGLADTLAFPGSIPHHMVPATLAAFDICIIPDTQDWSSPTKYFECAAMARPVVGARSPATVEVFGTAEPGARPGGLLFERNDARGFVDQCLRVLDDEDLARDLGEAGRARVLERYTWDRSVDVIEDLLRRMGAPC